MKIKSFLHNLLLVLFVCLSSLSLSFQNINDSKVVNAKEDNEIITIQDISNFLKTKESHYPLSDEFIEKYQQDGGGYIDYAKSCGITVNKLLHEPNQKWHFFSSWLDPKLEDGSILLTGNAKDIVYNKLLCPELLLWIYEACEVSPVKVKQAMQVAIQGKVNKTHTSTVAKQMREKVPYEDIQATISAYKNSIVDPFKITVNSSNDFNIVGLNESYKVGSNVTFTINVINNDKTIEAVKVNNSIIAAIDNIYTFTMPASDTNIEIILKDKIKASEISIDNTNIEMEVNDSKTINVQVNPNNTTDTLSYEILEGVECINVSINENKLIVKALKEGNSKLKVFYNETVFTTCTIKINKSQISNAIKSSIYEIKYDLGTRKTAKALEASTDIFNCFKNTNDYSLIKEIAQFDKIYGGANGGSNDNKWISNDLLKFGTQSVNGSLTLSLNAYVNAIKITGYVQSNSCKIKVGDSQSLDWSNQSNLDNKTTTLVCSTMTETTKETITNKELSTITLNFEPTNNLKIATINAKPLYISSIELLYVNQ